MSMKETWIKVIEYASKPHLGISRKIRGGYSIEFNGAGELMSGDVVFEIYDQYLRVIVEEAATMTNMYFEWDKIASIKTVSTK